MSHFERNLKYLNDRRIFYRRDPINDKPTEVYNWGVVYSEGTYECYSLFRSKAKITTYKSLKWHLLVLWYLNPKMDQDDFADLAEFICNKKNGFITFTVPVYVLEKIIYEVSMYDLERPPKNKKRKLIFYDNTGLSLEEKLKIVGKYAGRGKNITEAEIYEVMLYMHDSSKKITISAIAKQLKCSTRTIHRNMNNELKKEKELLNQEL